MTESTPPPADAEVTVSDSWPSENQVSSSAALGVLIVDDEPAVLESLEMTLEEGCQVFTAATGEEGLAVFDAQDIALVISDQRLTGMSGADFLTAVYARKPDCIRLMLTGYADLSAIMRAVNEGHVYSYISKPWDPDSLRITVRHALDSYRLNQENKRLTHALSEANEKLKQENLYLRREVEGRYSLCHHWFQSGHGTRIRNLGEGVPDRCHGIGDWRHGNGKGTHCARRTLQRITQGPSFRGAELWRLARDLIGE